MAYYPFSVVFLLFITTSWFVSGEFDEAKQDAFNEIASAVLAPHDLEIRSTVVDVATLFDLPIDETVEDVDIYLKSHGVGVLDKRITFSTNDHEHRVELNTVVQIFNGASSFSNFIERARILRVYLNPGLYNHALRSVALQNKHGFLEQIFVPELFNVAARSFFTDETISDAVQHAREGKRIGKDFKVFSTGTLADPEQKLAWFREDIGLNAFHNTISVTALPYPRTYLKFFINARYNAERLAAGLDRVKPLNLDDERITIEEGYDPHMSTCCGSTPAARPAGMTLQDDIRDPDNKRTISKMRYTREKLIDAVRTGFFIDEWGSRVPVTHESLSNTMKGPVEKSANARVYGTETFAMTGHLLLSAIADPRGQYNQERGVIGADETALRDPVTYRWHATLSEIVTEFKETLPSYSIEDLYAPVVANAIKIQIDEAGSHENVLETFIEKRRVDVGMDLSIAREVDDVVTGPIEVGIERLNHKPFHYHISLKNRDPIHDFTALVRIFIAPINDETGTPFKSLNEQRQFFIEMDKFVAKLHPGDNLLERSSTLSAVSHPVLLTMGEQRQHKDNPDITPACPAGRGVFCGWPLNLLVPRGTTSGMDFDLFAMVTDWSEDRSEDFQDPASGDTIFDQGIAVCGTGSNPSINPDRRPMGFPFDRKFREKSLSKLTVQYENMVQSKITIYHRE